MTDEGVEYLKEIKSPNRLKRILEFEVPRARVEAEVDGIIENIRRDIALPGFRKGKAPLDVVRARFAETARKEALDRLIPDAYEGALKKEGLRPVLPAEICALTYGDEGPLSFQISVELFPEVELKAYRGIKARKEVKPVEAADVDREIEALRERMARLDKIDGPAENSHIAVIDYWRIGEFGEPVKGSRVTSYPVDIGPGRLVKEFDAGLVGMRGGGEKTIEVIYPEDFGDEGLKGKTVKFGVEVKEVARKILPDLDDAFAKTLKAESLEDLRSKVSEGLERAYQQEAVNKVKHEIVGRIVTENVFEVPDGLVDMMLESMMKSYGQEGGEGEAAEDPQRDSKLEEIRQRMKPLAVNLVKEQFVIDEIARRENLEATDEDIDGILRSIALRAGISVEEARARAEKSEETGRWRRDILRNKVLDFLYQNAEVQG
jgi:trigger factor